MKTKAECSARLNVKIPSNVDIQIVSIATEREVIIQSYRQSTIEEAKDLVIEVVRRINKALDES